MVGRLTSEAAEGEWVSLVAAGRILGIAPSTVSYLVQSGALTSRSYGRRWVPSLLRADVEELARERRARLAARDRADAERERRRLEELPPEPVGGDAWLTTGAAAAVLGVSSSAVRKMAQRDQIAHTRRGRRLWFRRSHVEQLAAARAWMRAQKGLSVLHLDGQLAKAKS